MRHQGPNGDMRNDGRDLRMGNRQLGNVWSAASPQAKCEDVTGWSPQMYTALLQ